MNYQQLCVGALEVVSSAAEFIKKEALRFDQSRIEYKGKNNLVSYVDKGSERILVEGLHHILPGAGFITEEDTPDSEGQYRWIIDPLDGTTNFTHGVPLYCISVALMENEKVVIGIVHDIQSGESFYASKNDGAYLNGKEIRVSQIAQLEDSLIATGFPYYDYSRMKEYMQVFDFCMNQTHGVRRLGSAALDLAYVACGRFEMFYEYGLHAWDVAAGAYIVQIAGGTVTDFKGDNDYIFGGEIVAGNTLISAPFLEIIKSNFK